MPRTPQAQTVQIPEDVSQELRLLQGFRDLVAERWGYFVGRRMKQAEMNEATETERKAVRDVRVTISGDKLKELIKASDIDTYEATLKAVAEAQKIVSEKAKPYRDAMSPLLKAQKYMDNVAVPDALKELGTPVKARFTLSEWLEKTLEAKKKEKRNA